LGSVINSSSIASTFVTENVNESRIIKAADQNNIDILKSLLDQGGNPNEKGKFEATALHKAAFNGHKPTASILINSGADINAKDFGGATPLHIATRQGNTDMVRLLIQSGAEIDVKDNEGYTPLHRAILNNSTPAAMVLLEAGAEPNTTSRSGDTPLIDASRKGNNVVVEDLIAKGADKSKINSRGLGADDYAKKNLNVDVSQTLTKSKSDILRNKAANKSSVIIIDKNSIDNTQTPAFIKNEVITDLELKPEVREIDSLATVSLGKQIEVNGAVPVPDVVSTSIPELPDLNEDLKKQEAFTSASGLLMAASERPSEDQTNNISPSDIKLPDISFEDVLPQEPKVLQLDKLSEDNSIAEINYEPKEQIAISSNKNNGFNQPEILSSYQQELQVDTYSQKPAFIDRENAIQISDSYMVQKPENIANEAFNPVPMFLRNSPNRQGQELAYSDISNQAEIIVKPVFFDNFSPEQKNNEQTALVAQPITPLQPIFLEVRPVAESQPNILQTSSNTGMINIPSGETNQPLVIENISTEKKSGNYKIPRIDVTDLYREKSFASSGYNENNIPKSLQIKAILDSKSSLISNVKNYSTAPVNYSDALISVKPVTATIINTETNILASQPINIMEAAPAQQTEKLMSSVSETTFKNTTYEVRQAAKIPTHEVELVSVNYDNTDVVSARVTEPTSIAKPVNFYGRYKNILESVNDFYGSDLSTKTKYDMSALELERQKTLGNQNIKFGNEALTTPAIPDNQISHAETDYLAENISERTSAVFIENKKIQLPDKNLMVQTSKFDLNDINITQSAYNVGEPEPAMPKPASFKMNDYLRNKQISAANISPRNSNAIISIKPVASPNNNFKLTSPYSHYQKISPVPLIDNSSKYSGMVRRPASFAMSSRSSLIHPYGNVPTASPKIPPLQTTVYQSNDINKPASIRMRPRINQQLYNNMYRNIVLEQPKPLVKTVEVAVEKTDLEKDGFTMPIPAPSDNFTDTINSAPMANVEVSSMESLDMPPLQTNESDKTTTTEEIKDKNLEKFDELEATKTTAKSELQNQVSVEETKTPELPKIEEPKLTVPELPSLNDTTSEPAKETPVTKLNTKTLINFDIRNESSLVGHHAVFGPFSSANDATTYYTDIATRLGIVYNYKLVRDKNGNYEIAIGRVRSSDEAKKLCTIFKSEKIDCNANESNSAGVEILSQRKVYSILGEFKSADEANNFITSLQGISLGQTDFAVAKASENSEIYLLQIGPVSSGEEAKDICDTLKKSDQQCKVAVK